MFVDGFLSLCSSAGAGAAVEIGLPRQPISFALTSDRHPVTGVFGLARSTAPVRFPAAGVTGALAGLGLFSSPTGGALLLAMPFAAGRANVGGGTAYQAGTGDIALIFDALAANANPASEPNQPFASGATVGSWWDAPALGPLAVVPAPGAFVPSGGYVPAFVNSAPLTAGVGLVIQRGVLNIQL